MADDLSEVKPGELITASDWNVLQGMVRDLDQRVKVLEGQVGAGGRVAITGIAPTPPLHVGDEIHVIGRNFLVPSVLNVVLLDAVRVGSFKFSSSVNELVFNVPQVPGLPKTVRLAITNLNGEAATDLALLPQVVLPTGRIELSFDSGPAGPIAAGNADFTFTARAFVNTLATYRIDASMAQSGWSVSFPDGQTFDLAGDPTGASAGARRQFRVRVAVPGLPNGTVGTLTVSVSETGGTVASGHVPPVAIQIGSGSPQSDNRVRVSLRSTSPTFPRTTGGQLSFNLRFDNSGAYSVTASLANSTGWTGLDWEPRNGNAVGGAADTELLVFAAPQSAAQATNLLIRVQQPNLVPAFDTTFPFPVTIV